MKKLLVLIIMLLIIAAIGCTEKGQKDNNVNTTETPEVEATQPKEGPPKEISREGQDWYMYTYIGPPNETNSENARMVVIKPLRELGWDGGINIAYGDTEHIMLIALPFRLTNKTTDYINQSLIPYDYEPVKMNEIVK